MWKTKYFNNLRTMQKWISRNKKRYRIEEIFVNDGYAVDYKPLKFIYC